MLFLLLTSIQIREDIISVSSHPRITIASRFAVIIHVPYGRPAYGPETPSFRVSTREKKEGREEEEEEDCPENWALAEQIKFRLRSIVKSRLCDVPMRLPFHIPLSYSQFPSKM